jgi:hypothetical protein
MLVYHPHFSYSFLFWLYQSIGRPLLIGGEERNIKIHSISQRKLVSNFQAHEKKVNSVDITKLNTSEELHLVTVSIDEFLKVWLILVCKGLYCTSMYPKKKMRLNLFLGKKRTRFNCSDRFYSSHHVLVLGNRGNFLYVPCKGTLNLLTF